MRYYRTQKRNLTLEQMQNHHSLCEYDDQEIDRYNGICCTDSIEMLKRWIRGSGIDPIVEDQEVIIFEGDFIEEIPDGLVSYPRKIIKRYSFEKFMNLEED